MELALLGALATILACAVAGGLATTWGLHRRCLSLNLRVNDIEERLVTTKNRENAGKRWEKKASLEEEIEALRVQTRLPSRHERFSNDPVSSEEYHGSIRERG